MQSADRVNIILEVFWSNLHRMFASDAISLLCLFSGQTLEEIMSDPSAMQDISQKLASAINSSLSGG